MQIAYLVPEFPSQTHIFFWRERAALRDIGVATHLVSTRRPPEEVVSHDWAQQAEAETFYLADVGLRDVLRVGIELMRIRPSRWVGAVKAAMEGGSPKEWLINFALMFFAVRLIGFMRSNGLRHVHSHSCANSALIAMLANRLANVSYSLTLHAELLTYGRQQRVKWRYAAFAITITRQLYKEAQEQLGDDLPPQMGVAPMGVDPMIFKRMNAYECWAGEGRLRLFSCGRLNRMKGHQDLIEAVSILRTEGMDVCLEVAGEDEKGGRGFRKQLEDLIQQLQLTSSVVLLGAVAEKRIVEGLKSAHIFVLASHREGLGVATMEALSCETPVVATNVGGVPELIDHGVDGYLVPSQDPRAIADAIKLLASNPTLAKNFAASGRAKVLKHFNSTRSAGVLKRLLEQAEAAPAAN